MIESRRFGLRLNAWAACLLPVDAADAALRDARFATALATTSAFYETAASTELVKAAERRLERGRQQLVFAETRLEVGTATRSDALRAEIEQGTAELAVIDAESALRTARRGGRRVGSGPVAAHPHDYDNDCVRHAAINNSRRYRIAGPPASLVLSGVYDRSGRPAYLRVNVT